MSNRPKSKCCQSKFHPAKKNCGIGETNFYVCDNCGNPCDLIFPIQRHISSLEDKCFGKFGGIFNPRPLFTEKDFENELNNEFQNDCIAQEQKVFG